MTAASYTLRASVPPARSGFRWTLALLGVCLPVPICAVSGLSLPLPATVERIAASLVPWANGVAMSANEALRAGARGSIVAGSDDRSENGGARLPRVVNVVGTRTKGEGTRVTLLPGAVGPSLPGTTPTVPGAQPPTAPGQGAGYAQPGDGGPKPSGPATPESPAPGLTPTTPTEPTQPPVKGDPDPVAPLSPAPRPAPTTRTEPTQPPVKGDPDPVAPLKPVVDQVLAPVAPVVEETTKTVVETVAPVVPVLPGLGK